ncbi:MAG TPA: Hpt domain-containing protein [Candidatus Acidoferrales bacterium]|nr:Hpt domain-containing protein [Candidatus Acidoferrales bacterium]
MTPEHDDRRLNRKELLEHMLGDTALLTEMVRAFLMESETHLTELEQAVASGDARKVYVAAHTFKGAVSNFAAPLAVESAARLEQMGHSGNMSGATVEFAVLRREVELLKPLLLTACEALSQ